MAIYYKIIESEFGYFDIKEIGKRTTNADWSAIYLQTSIEHALNYLEHKAYLTNYHKLLLIELTTNLDCLKISDPIFGIGNITGEEKSNLLKKQFNISNDLLLMDNVQKPLLLLDNDCQYELVVPHYLFNESNFKIKILRTYLIKTIEKFGVSMKNIVQI